MGEFITDGQGKKMTAKQILTLIESVDPSDTAKLDEIEARVCEYLGGFSYFQSKHGCYSVTVKGDEYSKYWPHSGAYDGYCQHTGKKKKFPEAFPYSQFKYDGHLECPEYTRSRDALKAIRPEGWDFTISTQYKICWGQKGQDKTLNYVWSKTEELAELHAIIQAIEYDRGAQK
jgi:hypothetical protein